MTVQGAAQGTPGVVVRQQHLFTMDMMADLGEREDEIRAGLLYDAERGVVVWDSLPDTFRSHFSMDI